MLEATQDGFACIQSPEFLAEEMMSEDCLTLNIFTNRWELDRCRTLHSVYSTL